TTTTKDSTELQALIRFSANPLSRPPEISPKSKSSPISTATDDTPTSATKAACRVWANNLKSEWSAVVRTRKSTCSTCRLVPLLRRLLLLDSGAFSCWIPYLVSPPVESFSLVFVPSAISPRVEREHCGYGTSYAEKMRRYHKHPEEIKYRERQAARAAREAREAFGRAETQDRGGRTGSK
ncbi:hypothetical protein FS749_011215, partial [Ceratobasidium sp. UAMH 11750]